MVWIILLVSYLMKAFWMARHNYSVNSLIHSYPPLKNIKLKPQFCSLINNDLFVFVFLLIGFATLFSFLKRRFGGCFDDKNWNDIKQKKMLSLLVMNINALQTSLMQFQKINETHVLLRFYIHIFFKSSLKIYFYN